MEYRNYRFGTSINNLWPWAVTMVDNLEVKHVGRKILK